MALPAAGAAAHSVGCSRQLQRHPASITGVPRQIVHHAQPARLLLQQQQQPQQQNGVGQQLPSSPQQQQQRRQEQHTRTASRRAVALVAPVAAWALSMLASTRPAAAAADAPAAPAAAPPPAAAAEDAGAPSSQLQPFRDNEYELQVPVNYTYRETPIVRVERGPQPERSPVLGRFEAPAGQPGTISILMRKANALKQTLLQVADISQLGSPVEVAQLILPRGSTLLATATQTVPKPPKTTPLGDVEIPPETYYSYEFLTPSGDHVALSAGARRGTVYICGASTTAGRWQAAGPIYGRVVKSFRIRAQPTIS